jgi:hypothetical protein
VVDDVDSAVARALVVVWFAAALGGVVATLLAVVMPSERRRSLLLGACGGFAVAGALGILSVGIIFLAASMVCLVLAGRTINPRRVTRR